ncbi:MAG TPA: LarC family nickel insertion protein [Chthonomonadaceae bacterium]|nr:LarC family nickel insertion protein [Chthonomonadaceae bacterium]
MMRIAYFDCFSGISGDMTLGALLHAGVEEAAWRAELAKLNVPGYEIKIGMVVKEGISAMDVDVVLHEVDQGHGRHLSDIEEILKQSGVSENIRCRALGAFTHLAHAEAKIHAMTPDSIHFHEVGAIDAIVDIVGACIGLEMLGIEKVYSSPLPFNRGWVECAHGTMPVPAPATMELLVGFPLRPDDRPKELITPTGAALLAEYVERTPTGEIAPVPPFIPRAIGYGAGKRDSWIPNMLRVVIGDTYTELPKKPSGTRRVERPHLTDVKPLRRKPGGPAPL